MPFLLVKLISKNFSGPQQPGVNLRLRPNLFVGCAKDRATDVCVTPVTGGGRN